MRNGMSVKEVSDEYGIPKSTCYDIKNGRYGHHKMGRSCYLGKDVENLLLNAIIQLSKWGFGLNTWQVQMIVRDYLITSRTPNKFKNNTPGRKWFVLFRKRHPSLSARVPQNFPKNRAEALNRSVIESFYKVVNEKYNELELHDKPTHVFNADETGFSGDLGRQYSVKKVNLFISIKILISQLIIPKLGTKHPCLLVGNLTKTSYTVNYCCNAAGQYLPPFVIYKNKTIYPSWTEDGPPGTKYTVSPSGWMESCQFIEWFKGIFLEATANLVGPKLLYLDGHGSHVSLELIDLAIANNVTLLCLPAHSSAHFQPLDVAVYSEVKKNWRIILEKFYRTTRYDSINKQSSPRLLNELQQSAFKPQHATAGFYKTGLFPYNPSKVSLNHELVELNMPHEQDLTTRTDQTPVEYFSQVTHRVASDESNNPAVQDVSTIVQAFTPAVQASHMKNFYVLNSSRLCTLILQKFFDWR